MNSTFTHILFAFGCFAISTAVPNNLWAQPLDAPYGCHHIHNNFNSWGVFGSRSEEAQKVTRRSDTLNLYHYNISLDVTNFNSGRIIGHTTVFLEVLMDSVDIITLDLESLQVDSVKRDQQHLTYFYDDRFIRVREDSLLNKGDSIFLEVFYRGTPITCPSGFGGFYFEDGYAYNLGIGLAANPHNFGRSWFPCFDNFVQRSTFEYHVKSSGGRRAHCVGRFIGEEKLGGDTLIRSYLMEQPIPTYLSSVAVSNYQTMDWTHQGAYGPVDIQLVARSGDLQNFRNSMEDLEQAIDALEYWYGPYPFERVGYVLTTRGAMEHPTNTAYPGHTIAGGQKSTRLMAHELCHNWWGNITTLSTAMDMWIKEGPAEYGAHLTQEFINGKAGLRESVINNHKFTVENAHVVDDGYYALSPMPAHNTYGRHTYNRGASMIHNLRGYLGDSLFRAGMQEVLSNNYFSSIDAERFRDELTQYTGIDLTHFFDDWIFAPGYSDFSLDSLELLGQVDSENQIAAHFKQRKYNSPHYHQNVPIQLELGNRDSIQTVYLTASDSISTDTFSLNFVPDWAVINSDQHLNLGSFTQVFEIEERGQIQDAITGVRINTIEIGGEEVRFFVEHHLTGPDEIKADEPLFRLSKNHYYKIGGNFDDNWDAQLFFRYEGGGTFPLDEDLVTHTEDSIILVYRPDRSADWIEYPHYGKNPVVPNDGRGFLIATKILPGEYAFANSFFLDPTNVTSGEINNSPLKLFPNPTTDFVHLESAELEGEYSVKIYDIDGKSQESIFQHIFFNGVGSLNKISVSELNPGMYFMELQSNHSNDPALYMPFVKQ